MSEPTRLGLDWRTIPTNDPKLPVMLQRYMSGRGWVDATTFGSVYSAAASLVERHSRIGDAPDVPRALEEH